MLHQTHACIHLDNIRFNIQDIRQAGVRLPALKFSPAFPEEMEAAITRVSFLKKVPAGTSIGYGRTWIAPEDTWIATFPAGYADGFNRLFSNRSRVLTKERSFPVVSRVCMDQSMANLGTQTNI